MQIRQPWWCNIFWSSLQLYDKKCFGICKCQKELGLLKNLLRYFALFSGVVYIFCLQNRSLGLISFFGRAIKRHFFGGEKELEPVFCTKYNNKETGIKKWWANIWKNVGQQKEVFKIATVRQLVFFLAWPNLQKIQTHFAKKISLSELFFQNAFSETFVQALDSPFWSPLPPPKYRKCKLEIKKTQKKFCSLSAKF